jgi:hypothetical protein
MRNIKKEMMEVTGGEFSKWYKSLSDEEKKEYHIQFKKISKKGKPKNIE